jgi:hypothetical protein
VNAERNVHAINLETAADGKGLLGPSPRILHGAAQEIDRLTSELAEARAERTSAAGEVTRLLATNAQINADRDMVRSELAEARAELEQALNWEDIEDAWTAAITAAHPTRSGSHGEYRTAMKMVGHRHSKGELVSLVNWLLLCAKPTGCPCLYTTPCDPSCTCVQQISSHGCSRCCSYGDPGQRRALAAHLASTYSELAAKTAECERDGHRLGLALGLLGSLAMLSVLDEGHLGLEQDLHRLHALQKMARDFLDAPTVPARGGPERAFGKACGRCGDDDGQVAKARVGKQWLCPGCVYEDERAKAHEEGPKVGHLRASGEETKVPSERMRAKARAWLYHPDHPNETASEREVDDLATLLDDVRRNATEEAAAHIEGHCCVSSCCDAQPGASEAKALSACVLANAKRLSV